MVTVGGIGEKPVVIEWHTATRESLSLTISVDHDLVNCTLTAHFTQRLKELIECGHGLSDSMIESEQDDHLKPEGYLTLS